MIHSSLYWISIVVLALLFPFNLNTSYSLFQLNNFFKTDIFLTTVIGVITGISTIRLFKFPQKIYIFFHELSHSIAVLLVSGEIEEFKVSDDYGYIKSKSTGLFVTLAPYLFPLLSFLTLVAFSTVHFFIRYFFEKAFDTSQLSLGIHALCVTTYIWTTFYNGKLLKRETTDIPEGKVIVSFMIIMHSWIFTSTMTLGYSAMNWDGTSYLLSLLGK